MKAKKIVALVAGFAVAATMTVGFSACGNKGSQSLGTTTLGPQPLGTTTLNLADYAQKLERNNYKKGFTSAKQIAKSSTITREGRYLIIKGENNRFSVYDICEDKFILSNLASAPEYESIIIGNSLPIGISLNLWKVRSEQMTSGIYTYAYYYMDGRQLLDYGNYADLGCYTLQAYVGTDTVASTVYVFTYYNDTMDLVEVYFKLVKDKQTNKNSFVKVPKSDVKAYGPEYEIGSQISVSLENVCRQSKYSPVEGDIAEYKFNHIGTVITFYKGTEKTGSVDMTTNGYPIAFVGNCMYYSVLNPYVPAEHEGYNYANTTAGEFKFNYSLYKYDIIANSTTQLNYDVYIASITPLYNQETKAYDAAIINGYKMTDGVVTIFGNDEAALVGSEHCTYLVDDDMNVAYDMTGKFNDTPDLYELPDGKFLITDDPDDDYGEGYIVDKDFNVLRDNVEVSDVFLESDTESSGDTDSAKGMIKFFGENAYGLTDLDGKVVVPPEYYSIGKFYGGIARAKNLQGEDVFLNINGSVTATRISDLTKNTDTDVEKILTLRDGYYIIETTVGEYQTIGKAYYAYDGTLLKSFDHGNVSEITVDGVTCLCETTMGETVYYKLV